MLQWKDTVSGAHGQQKLGLIGLKKMRAQNWVDKEGDKHEEAMKRKVSMVQNISYEISKRKFKNISNVVNKDLKNSQM